MYRIVSIIICLVILTVVPLVSQERGRPSYIWNPLPLPFVGAVREEVFLVPIPESVSHLEQLNGVCTVAQYTHRLPPNVSISIDGGTVDEKLRLLPVHIRLWLQEEPGVDLGPLDISISERIWEDSRHHPQIGCHVTVVMIAPTE